MFSGFLNYFEGQSQARLVDPSKFKASPQALQKSVETLSSAHPPRSFQNPQSLQKVAQWIRAEWEAQGLRVQFQEFSAGGNQYRNVITSLGPADAPRIVLGAHYDVAGENPGADDNASGVAGLIEAARILVKEQSQLRHRVELVAYCLEEPPFFGSQEMGSFVHASSLKAKRIEVRLMLSLEMIGYFSEVPGSQDFPLESLKMIYPNSGNFIAVVGKLNSVRLTSQVKKLMKKNSVLEVHSINAPESIAGVSLSDHRNYWHQGYPALMITDTAFFRNPNYHSAKDLPQTLNFVKMAEVVNGVVGVVRGF